MFLRWNKIDRDLINAYQIPYLPRVHVDDRDGHEGTVVIRLRQKKNFFFFFLNRRRVVPKFTRLFGVHDRLIQKHSRSCFNIFYVRVYEYSRYLKNTFFFSIFLIRIILFFIFFIFFIRRFVDPWAQNKQRTLVFSLRSKHRIMVNVYNSNFETNEKHFFFF